jgi:glycosyltransferase involved in cell wall biosynthesis
MRVLMMVPGDVGTHMSGPAIRGWQLARALAPRFEVTAAVEGTLPDEPEPGVRAVPATRGRLLRETLRHDAIVGACLPPYALAAARVRNTITVADHYDPVELELGTIADSGDRRVRAVRAVRRLQHRHVDVVVCAGASQRRLLTDELSAVGRTGTSAPDVAIVPFGLAEPPARTGARPLRERFPQIAESDRIVLWWGKIWSWFDAETAIRAFAPLADSRPDLKLVLTTGPAPDATTEAYSADAGARRLAAELGLLNRSVFFLEEWIPYDERQHCLHEADLGLTLHADTPEAEFAARARYMDYAWTSLPCVLARGDEVADEFGRAGFARLVDPGDPAATTSAIIELLDTPGALERARTAGAEVAERYRWNSVATGLAEALERAERRRTAAAAPAGSLELLGGTTAYYCRRLADRVVGASG